MASCFLKNPSPFTLAVCNGVGIVAGLFGVPYAVYKSSQYILPPTTAVVGKGLDATGDAICNSIKHLNQKINWDHPNVKVSTYAIEQTGYALGNGALHAGSWVMEVGDFLFGTQLRYGTFEIVLGSSALFQPIALQLTFFQKFKKRFISDPLINKSCCNRIRFFMLASLVHGFVTGCAIPGLFLITDGGFRIAQHFQGNKKDSECGLFASDSFKQLQKRFKGII